MLRPRTTLDVAGVQAKLDALAEDVRREAGDAEADPFDDAIVAAITGAAQAMKAEADALAMAGTRLRKLARRA